MKKLILLCVAIKLTGCASLQNEGVTSYGYQSPQGDLLNQRFLEDREDDPNNKHIIKEGDAFSVKLISAYICDFDESSFLGFLRTSNKKSKPCRDSPDRFQRDRSGTQGEIAIIANVGEQSSKSGLALTTQDLEDQGRVIYYNEDVREAGQLLNFINIPIYGPIIYKGKPFFMEFVVTEIDSQENKKMQALMGQLASLGEVAYPPAAPILGVLNSLGGALFKGNKDDVLMRYQMGFDLSGNRLSNIQRLGFSEGYYVFIREETRSNDTKWEDLKVNEKMGLLEFPKKDGTVFRDKTWLLIRIAREPEGSGTEQEIGQKFGAFQQKLNSVDADKEVIPELEKLQEDVKKLLNKAK